MFEQLIRSTKRLRKVIGKAKPDYDELLTVVTEVEMINSRPLSYVTPDNLEEHRTPHVTGFGKTLRMGFFQKIECDAWLIISTIELTRIQVLG